MVTIPAIPPTAADGEVPRDIARLMAPLKYEVRRAIYPGSLTRSHFNDKKNTGTVHFFAKIQAAKVVSRVDRAGNGRMAKDRTIASLVSLAVRIEQ